MTEMTERAHTHTLTHTQLGTSRQISEILFWKK